MVLRPLNVTTSPLLSLCFQYGIQSTYKDNLEGYTVQLSSANKNSKEYREKEAAAEAIARRIDAEKGKKIVTRFSDFVW